MKKDLILLSLFPLLLVSCNNDNDKPNPEEFVNLVANTASIACRRYKGRTEALIGADATYVYRPSTFKKDDHPNWPYIYSTNFSLDIWFEYAEDSPYRADITWTFSNPDIINYRLPSSDIISRATMTFKDSAFPTSYDEDNFCLLTGVITYENASATVTYEIIFRTLPDGIGVE